MKLFEKLGAKSEAEAIATVEAYESFASQLAELTGHDDPQAIIGVIAAWKSGSSTSEQRHADEAKRVEASIAKLAEAGVTHVSADSLREVYSTQGYPAFVDAAEQAREQHGEAHALIDELVESGRLQPAVKAEFVRLFEGSGIAALKAAAGVLPKAAQVKSGPAPKAKPAETMGVESLTEAELWAAKTTGKTPEQYAKAKAAEAAGN